MPDPRETMTFELRIGTGRWNFAGKIRRSDGYTEGYLTVANDAPEPEPTPEPGPVPEPPPPDPVPVPPQDRVLVPGTGWTGATIEPNGQGGARAIARWNAVPYDVATNGYHVGLRAVHASGMDRVEFAVENGPWTVVRDWTMNPRTGQWEYCVILDPAQWPTTRIVEIRAIAYPKAGRPRLLDPLRLWVGATPKVARVPQDFPTIKAAARALIGETRPVIQLAAGTHYFATPTNMVGPTRTGFDRWLTIEPQPGVPREQVNITTAPASDPTFASWTRSTLAIDMIRLRNVTVERLTAYAFPSDGAQGLWFDDVDYTWRDRKAAGSPNPCDGSFVHRFVTGGRTFDASGGMRSALLVSRHEMASICDQAFFQCAAVYDCSLDFLEPVPGGHPDVFHLEYTASPFVENCLWMNVVAERARGQGVYFDRNNIALAKDVGIVNFLIAQPTTMGEVPFGQGSGFFQSSLACETENVVLEHCSFLEQHFDVDGDRQHSGLTVRASRMKSRGFTHGSARGTWTDNRIGNDGPEFVARTIPFDAYGKVRKALTAVGAVEG